MPLEESSVPVSGDAAASNVNDGAMPPRTGLVLVDKPIGPSSFSVVAETARALNAPDAKRRLKAGHAGTLDPAASGLLLVLVGRATRLAQYLVGVDKRYRTEIQLGMTTTTGDAEGEQLDEGPACSTSDLGERLVGEIELPVPAASAVKIDGERAYKRLRRGEDFEMPLRISTIRSLDLVEQTDARVTLELLVSSGTYIRAIAHHLGGHCLSIRRLSVGPFDVASADSRLILKPAAALPFLPAIDIDEAEAHALRNGRALSAPGSGMARALFRDELVAVVRLADGLAHPETVIAR
jgi:tRNA pseudouridine55 synthase